MRDNSNRSVKEIREEGLSLIRSANIPDDEKAALAELMDELLAEGFSTPGKILKRIKVAIQVSESLVPEIAEMKKEVDAIFYPQ